MSLKIVKAGNVIAEAIMSGKISQKDVTRLIASANKVAKVSLLKEKKAKKEKKEKCSGGKCHRNHSKSAFDATKIVSSVGKKKAKKSSLNKTSRVQKISPRHCAKCNSLEHDIRICPDTVTCGKCGIRGHNSRGCSQ